MIFYVRWDNTRVHVTLWSRVLYFSHMTLHQYKDFWAWVILVGSIDLGGKLVIAYKSRIWHYLKMSFLVRIVIWYLGSMILLNYVKGIKINKELMTIFDKTDALQCHLAKKRTMTSFVVLRALLHWTLQSDLVER